MASHRQALLSIALFVVALVLWIWVANQSFSSTQNLSIIVGGVLLLFPVAWLGRKALDKQPTTSRAIWITTLVHYAVLIPFGAALIRAVITYQDWVGWTLPIPGDIGWYLVIPTGALALLAVVNLAWKGLGAPFAIALSRQLSVDWMYAWTRNPMVLATLAFLFALAFSYAIAVA
jgi:hypothetical protein